MLFCSSAFLVFFVVVFTLYWALPWQRPRVYLLLVASFYFYACWNHWLALLIFASTTADFFLAHTLARTTSPRMRGLVLTLSISGNLLLLGYFKYANFFLDSLGQLLRATGNEVSLPVLSLLLPIGISFYTFEAINYMVDVYRKHIEPEANLANFLLFILFFPHLVAGPIVRARDFLPQIRRKKRFSWLRARIGIQLFLLGLFKKLIVADRMALFVDPIFANPDAYHAGAHWMAMVAYALQIYGDFSGYSDMALGTAHLLGYHLAINFDMPYLAYNVSEFWRRWHISLSSWLRDYLFIPLGGSRHGFWLTARNLLLTMSLGGLWHGASWNFILWGLLHGLLLIGHRLFVGFCQPRPRLLALLDTHAGQLGRMGLTFLTVSLCWVWFRAETFEKALAFFQGLVSGPGLGRGPMSMEAFLLVAIPVLLGHWLGRERLWERLAIRLPGPVVGAAYGLALSLILFLAPPSGKAFIYFQF